MGVAIKVENLSKAYQLGEIGTGTISRDLERWFAKFRGKEDPFLKIGETNDRATKGTSDVVWSLKDINFDIPQGDAVGIIGRNGAGNIIFLEGKRAFTIHATELRLICDKIIVWYFCAFTKTHNANLHLLPLKHL